MSAHREPPHPVMDTSLWAGLVARRVMLDGPDAFTVVALGLDEAGAVKDGTILSASTRRPPGLDIVGLNLWVAAVRPTSIFIARSAPHIDFAYPNADDDDFFRRCHCWCHEHGVQLVDTLLVAERGMLAGKEWNPAAFRTRLHLVP